jgi:hypothetical protein
VFVIRLVKDEYFVRYFYILNDIMLVRFSRDSILMCMGEGVNLFIRWKIMGGIRRILFG